MKRQTEVFCSIAAQHDNLGDVVIRRSMIRWIAGTGVRVSVYIGRMPESYIEACELPVGARVVRSSFKFQMLLLLTCLRRRVVMVFAPGPQAFGTRPGLILKALINLANVALVRLSGGSAIAVGRSLRGSGKLTRLIERTAIRFFNLYRVRDEVSGGVVGVNLLSCPDLAFDATGPDSGISQPRSLFAISVRGDRELYLDAIATAIDFARSIDLTPVFITQVKRDNDRHLALAAQLGAEVIEWTDETHQVQLSKLDVAYSRAAFVLTDRLHAAILGSINGALPVDFAEAGRTKIKDTLSGLVPLTIWHPTDLAAQRALKDQLGDEHQRLVDAIKRNGQELARLKDTFRAQLCA